MCIVLRAEGDQSALKDTLGLRSVALVGIFLAGCILGAAVSTALVIALGTAGLSLLPKLSLLISELHLCPRPCDRTNAHPFSGDAHPDGGASELLVAGYRHQRISWRNGEGRLCVWTLVPLGRILSGRTRMC